ncbi:MAG: alpha/beta hydrolase [Acidobacteriota bacterium]
MSGRYPAMPISKTGLSESRPDFRFRRGRGRVELFVMTLMLLAGRGAEAQESRSWQDASKHQVKFVTVGEGVRLEVLDWGGAGRDVVLLAGYNTAHIFDEFAEVLSQACHVYGITRRGYGASSRPDSGYTAKRSAADVLEVLAALKLRAPVLAGHSFGGQDLSTIGAEHSERIGALVYLNSAEDPTLGAGLWPAIGVDPSELDALRKRLPGTMQAGPAPPDHRSFQAYRAWQARAQGIVFPEAELRQLFVSNSDGTMGWSAAPSWVRDAIFQGKQKPAYASIRVPVLAFFAYAGTLADYETQYQPQTSDERAALERNHAIHLAIVKKHIRDLTDGVPAARVIEVPKANYYIFLSNQDLVLREMRAFLEALR